MNIEPSLLEILACPACHSALVPDDAAEVLACSGCGLRYPVRDDIPVLLVDEAERPGGTAGGPAGAADGSPA